MACSGAEPIGITNCLNFGSPETPPGYWQLAEAVAAWPRRAAPLDLPIVSGNVSLYNETPDGPILPTPVVGTVGLLADRSRAGADGWRDGDEIWLLGDAGADPERAGRLRACVAARPHGGTPRLDLDAAVRVVRLLVSLAADGILAGAHDLSVGGLGVALARMAIASGRGAAVSLPTAGAALPTAALFGERGGRVIVAVAPEDGARVADVATAADIPAARLGKAQGPELQIALGGSSLRISVDALASAWETPF